MQNILTVQRLKKSYKNKEVIHGISFDVLKGERLCFLGANGSRKSTTSMSLRVRSAMNQARFQAMEKILRRT